MGGSLDVLREACGALPHAVRSMFGGHGFFAPNGGMFAAIVTDDAIVLKFTMGAPRDAFIARGGSPWVWTGGSKPMTMREWIVLPADLYDDFEELAEWVKRAHQLAPAKSPAARKSTARKKSVKKKSAAKKTHARGKPTGSSTK